MNSFPNLEPSRTVIINGFSNSIELEKYKNAIFNPETMLEQYSVSQSNLLFILFYDLRESIKFLNNFKKSSSNFSLNISFTISKYELPRKNEDCSEKNKQSTVMFEFIGIDMNIADEFVINLLKPYGDIKELKGTSPLLKVIEFYSIKDATKAFNTLNNSPFGAGEIQCRWDWDLLACSRRDYLKITDEFIKSKPTVIVNYSIPEPVKRFKIDQDGNKNMFIDQFDKFIIENIAEIEKLFL
jgi:hypothetical protein